MTDDETANCRRKQADLRFLFDQLSSSEEKYKKIIEFGKKLDPLPAQYRVEELLVEGCQSRLYLRTSFSDGRLHFQAHSDALISAGLAALLIRVYDCESPKTILTCPPVFIKELNLHSALSPGRSNGLSSMFLRMQREALAQLSTSA